MRVHITSNYDETLTFAADFAKHTPVGSVIGFIGGLGAGKTAFVSGFVKGLGIEAEVSSPTFSICNMYSGYNTMVFHYDMYRIDNWDDLYTTGFMEAVDSGAYVLCEWSENIFNALPNDAIMIKIDKLSENERKFTIMTKREVKNL